MTSHQMLSAINADRLTRYIAGVRKQIQHGIGHGLWIAIATGRIAVSHGSEGGWIGVVAVGEYGAQSDTCLLYTSPSPRD